MAKRYGFEDPIAPEKGRIGKSPWNFEAPPYDERTSCFIEAGTDYGLGFRQPVGRVGKAKTEEVVPTGKMKTLQTDYVYTGRPDLLEIEE